MNANHLLGDSTLMALEQQDKDLGEQVRKWKPRILSLADKLMRVTGDTFEDAIQDFLQKMWNDVNTFRTPQVRYQKQIWEVVSEEENEILHLRRSGKELIISRLEIEEVKKASLGTFVYSGLTQYYQDRLQAHYTAKNGYAVDEGEPVVQVVVRNSDGVTAKKFPNYKKVSGFPVQPIVGDNGILQDPVDLAPSKNDSVEDLVVFSTLVEHLKVQVSPAAAKLLDFLLQRDEDFHTMIDLEILRCQGENGSPKVIRIDEIAAAKQFALTREQIRSLKLEIIEALPQDFLQYTTVSFTEKTGYAKEYLVRAALGK
jgi:hypothetical protein